MSIATRAQELKRGVMEDTNESGYYTVAALALIAEAIAELTEQVGDLVSAQEQLARERRAGVR